MMLKLVASITYTLLIAAIVGCEPAAGVGADTTRQEPGVSASGSGVTVFTDSASDVLMQITTDDGATVTVKGARGPDGLPSAAKSIHIVLADGTPGTRVELDALGRPTSLTCDDGTSARITWQDQSSSGDAEMLDAVGNVIASGVVTLPSGTTAREKADLGYGKPHTAQSTVPKLRFEVYPLCDNAVPPNLEGKLKLKFFATSPPIVPGPAETELPLGAVEPDWNGSYYVYEFDMDGSPSDPITAMCEELSANEVGLVCGTAAVLTLLCALDPELASKSALCLALGALEVACDLAGARCSFHNLETPKMRVRAELDTSPCGRTSDPSASDDLVLDFSETSGIYELGLDGCHSAEPRFSYLVSVSSSDDVLAVGQGGPVVFLPPIPSGGTTIGQSNIQPGQPYDHDWEDESECQMWPPNPFIAGSTTSSGTWSLLVESPDSASTEGSLLISMDLTRESHAVRAPTEDEQRALAGLGDLCAQGEESLSVEFTSVYTVLVGPDEQLVISVNLAPEIVSADASFAATLAVYAAETSREWQLCSGADACDSPAGTALQLIIPYAELAGQGGFPINLGAFSTPIPLPGVDLDAINSALSQALSNVCWPVTISLLIEADLTIREPGSVSAGAFPQWSFVVEDAIHSP